ncbi:MAG: hypothetical protein ACOYL6_14900 [Bacteriovoracaceae bacterium]
MKKLFFLAFAFNLSLLSNAFAQVCHESSLYEVYETLNTLDQTKLQNELTEHQLDVDHLKEVNYKIECQDTKLLATVELLDKEETPKNQFLMKIGVGYMYPVGTNIAMKFGVGDKFTGVYKFNVTVEASSTLTFKMGSSNVYGISANYYLKKTGVYMGPIAHVVHLNNPLLIGQQNFFFKAVGLNAGWEIPVKSKNYRSNIELNAFTSFGGYNNDPKPFIYSGGGIRFMIPQKRQRKN